MLKTIFVNLRNIFLVGLILYIFYYGYILYIVFGPMNVYPKKNDDPIKEISLAKGTIHIEEKKETEKRYYKQLSYTDAHGKTTQITTDPWSKYDFKVSPDKKKVSYNTYYSENDESDYRIKVFNEETGTMITLCKSFSWCDEVYWSPDSKAISFIFQKEDRNGGAVIDIEHGRILFMETIQKASQDYQPGHYNFTPIIWMNSPQQIVYSSKGDLTIYNLTTKQKKIIGNDVADTYLGDRTMYRVPPRISDNSRFIIYIKGKTDYILDSDYTSVYDTYLGLTTNIPVVN